MKMSPAETIRGTFSSLLYNGVIMEALMKKHYQTLIIVMLVFTLLMTGCRSKKSNYTSRENGAVYTEAYNNYAYETDEMMDMAYAAEEPVAVNSKAVPAASDGTASGQKRMIQKSASINIQVMDPLNAAEKVIDMTEQMGGFVVSSSNSQEYYSGEIYLPRASLSIRVPAERLNEMLGFLEGLTSDASKYVSNKRIYGVDITSEYVDTRSRLTSMEKTLEKLYEILDTAENAEEALDVYNRISEVESDIEVYKGQLKYMEETVAFSSIDVQISSVRPDPIKTVQKWSLGEVFKDAFESLLDNGKTAIEALVYFIIVIIPIIILIAIPILFAIWLVRKIIRRKKKAASGIASEVPAEDKLAEVRKN